MDPANPERRIQTVCLLILSTVALAVALYWLRPVLIPFVLAAFLTIGLTPVVDFQVRRLRMPRPLAALTAVAMGCVLLVLVGFLLASSARQLVANAGRYQARFSQLLDQAASSLPPRMSGLVRQTASAPCPDAAAGATSRPGGDAPAAIPWDLPDGTVRALIGLANEILNVISQGAVVIIFTCFLLLGGTTRKGPRDGIMGEIECRIRRYIVNSVIMAVATGALVGLVLWVLKVELALVFGLLAFLLSFIPILGAVVATLLPIPMVLIDPEVSMATVVLAVALPGLVQFLIANVASPRMMGKSFNLHPVVIVMTLVFWGKLWGMVGMFLATPLTVVVMILLERTSFGAPIARLLSGRMSSDAQR